MGLSSWDCIAFDNDGNPCAGGEEDPNSDISIHIRKNWLVVDSPSMFSEVNGGFLEPTISTVQEGDVRIGPLSVQAVKHPEQNSIFVYARFHHYIDEEVIDHKFAGVGCWGYQRTGDVQRIMDTIGVGFVEQDVWPGTLYENGEMAGMDLFVPDSDPAFFEITFGPDGQFETDEYVGLKRDTYERFLSWLTEVCEDKEWLEKIGNSDTLGFNQGNAYFASAMGKDTPGYRPGEAV